MKVSIPFEMENPMWFAETEGILSADDTDLKLEFQTTDNILGVIKSEVRQVKLPIDTIEEITLQKRFLQGSFIVIRVNEMRNGSTLPGFKKGEIALEIDRKHREAAQEFVSSVQIGVTARKR